MKYLVFLTDSVVNDVVEIWKYVAINDSMSAADSLKNSLKKTISQLALFPGRGHIPPELEQLGIEDYKEVHSGPYRIVFTMKEAKVYVIAVFDGRRALQEILAQRCINKNFNN